MGTHALKTLLQAMYTPGTPSPSKATSAINSLACFVFQAGSVSRRGCSVGSIERVLRVWLSRCGRASGSVTVRKRQTVRC